MNWHITLDPQCGLSAFDFIITWNATPECKAVATARTGTAAPIQFDMHRATGNHVVLSGAGDDIAGETIGGLVRGVLEKRGVRQRLELIQTDLPDTGRGILVKL